MSSSLRQIIKNVYSSWLAILAQAGISFFLIPFLITQLGTDGYGLIGLLGVLLGFSQIADLGLRSALGRELSEQVALKNKIHFNELLTTSLFLYILIATILVSLGWILAPWFVSIFKIPEPMQLKAILLIRLYGTGAILLSFITPVFDASLSSYHRFDVINLIKTISGICSGICMFIILPHVPDALFGWVYIMLGNQLLMMLLSIFFVFRLCNGVSIGFSFFSPRRLIPLFKLGGYMYALQLTNALSAQSDPLVISSFFGPKGVALYRPGQRLSSMARPIVSALSNQLYPLTTQHHVNQKMGKMQSLLIVGTKFTLLLGVLTCVGLFFCAEPLCKLWLSDSLGGDYTIVATIVMGWAIVDLMSYASGTQWPVLLGMKRLKFLIWTQLPTAILNILVSIYLVGFTSLGIPGVLAATIIIGLIRRPIIIVYTARVCELKLRDYLKQAYWRPLLVLVGLSSFAFLYKEIFSLTTWSTLILFALFVGVVWLLLLLSIGMDKNERNLLFGLFQKWMKKL